MAANNCPSLHQKKIGLRSTQFADCYETLVKEHLSPFIGAFHRLRLPQRYSSRPGTHP